MLVLEVARNDELVAVLTGQDQVRSGALEIGVKQEVRVRNGDRRGVRPFDEGDRRGAG